MSSKTDRALLIAAAAGEESAFTELYGRYATALRTYFIKCLDADAAADDLVQQVFLQLLGSRAFRQPKGGPEKLDKLLFTYAKNLVRNHVRGDRRRSGREATFQQLTDTPDELPVNTPALHAALRQLPDHQRQPLVLRFRHGLKVEDIAHLMQCAPGTIKSRLHYGLKRLANLLHPLQKDNDPPRP